MYLAFLGLGSARERLGGGGEIRPKIFVGGRLDKHAAGGGVGVDWIGLDGWKSKRELQTDKRGRQGQGQVQVQGKGEGLGSRLLVYRVCT